MKCNNDKYLTAVAKIPCSSHSDNERIYGKSWIFHLQPTIQPKFLKTSTPHVASHSRFEDGFNFKPFQTNLINFFSFLSCTMFVF